MVAAADHIGKQPQQGLSDHFNELMESPCTNHAYSVKHLYKDCELLKHFLRQAGGPKEGDGKEAVDAKVDLQTQRANTRIDIQSVLVDLTC